MKLEHIKLFLEVAQKGSISEAAKDGYITQQGLSLALRQIENELGVELFHRSNKGVTLTDIGREFYTCAKGMFRLYDDFLFDIQEGWRNDVFNLYITNNICKMFSSLNKTPFARKNGWYFSYVERSLQDTISMINQNKGIAIFSTHAGVPVNTLETLNDDVSVYNVGSESHIVYIVHKNHPLCNCASEDIDAGMEGMKCVIFSSAEYDLNLRTGNIYRTIAAPDIDTHKQLLGMDNIFSIMNYNMYKMHFSPTEYHILKTKKLKQSIQYYLAFHLGETASNLRLEQEMLKYLEEMLIDAEE